MRFQFFCVGLLLGLVGCGDIEVAPCGWFGCGEGSRCVNERCVTCGGAGETCCDKNVGGEYCTESGYGCDPTDGPGTCSKDCGVVGKPCCDDIACDPGSTCNGNDVCVGDISDPCYSGPNPFVVNIVTDACGYLPWTFWTETVGDAEDCFGALVAGPGEEICPLGVDPNPSHVCKDGESFGFVFYHCSAEQLALCEDNFCGDIDGCTWAECE